MRIAICDDDRLFLERFGAQVNSLELARRVDCFGTVQALFAALDDGAAYDAVLLDIDWQQDATGIDVAARLNEISPQSRIIYVTGYNDRFSQQIFLQKSNLSGYLLKPVDETLLVANLQKVAAALGEEQGPALAVSVGGKPVAIPHRDIVYLESLGHIVNIHTKAEVITVYEKLDRLAHQLPDGFLRCHKSFLVNMRCIRRFLEQNVLLENGASVPISRARYAGAKAAYFSYMGQTF